VVFRPSWPILITGVARTMLLGWYQQRPREIEYWNLEGCPTHTEEGFMEGCVL